MTKVEILTTPGSTSDILCQRTRKILGISRTIVYFTTRNKRWRANPKNLKVFALDLELDMDLFENCLDSGKYDKKVRFNAYEAKKNGLLKVPSFVLVNSEGGHHIIKGVSTYSVFEKMIEFLTK